MFWKIVGALIAYNVPFEIDRIEVWYIYSTVDKWEIDEPFVGEFPDMYFTENVDETPTRYEDYFNYVAEILDRYTKEEY